MISRWITWVISPQLKKELPIEPVPQLSLSNKTKVLSVSREYETDMITLFHATGDFNYRARWQEGVSRVEEVNHFLPRVGMKCRYIMDNSEVITYISNHYLYQQDKIEFSETDEMNKSVTYYRLEKTGDTKTRLTIDLYLKQNLPAAILFRLTKKNKMMLAFRKSLENLVNVVKEIGVHDVGEASKEIKPNMC